ncbi:PQQ-dependent sugar dehydrogenase [Chryseobacterium aquaticum]|uniref:PQQ-dependent sugar dehydrogenase n=1 Tax=Chryseobacterium aquaticum TaxID=452084 RepID=A0A848MXE1_9FLAO|nr:MULTISPECIES: PQQ-dependent sugar dehydrogenase [Chryseobacterium]NMR33237.1 PQQ-dependent sugar dehydrogenase [Chryseobacterium aquaticum]NRQ44831.1 PQQ-dependent sugar dehydrogenase [Chryseobacterium sp. C-204]
MKTNRFLVIMVGAMTAFSGCSSNDAENINQPEINPPSVGSPVETNPPNANYAPAFPGQTRVNGVTTVTPYQTTVVTSSLIAPWGITNLPDGRLLITEKAGSMRIVYVSGSVGNSITTGIPAVNSNGQGGLLGLCIDPQFSTNRMVYWVFSENVTGGTLTAVAKGRLSDNETAFENTTVIYRANPGINSTAHYGGRILFDATGNLLVSTGERANTPTRTLAQSVTAAIGKIVRITRDGLPASGNPTFVGAGALPELYSIGHRNPQGIALHPTTGDLWQSEHGPRGGDEINRVQAGANYGWPTITYGLEYSGQAVGSGIQQQNGMQQPAYYWDPVISPSGMTFYRGNSVPEWQNNLFIGSLSGMHIARLVIENNVVTGEERLLTGLNQRFRDITQGTDNALYAITDAGRLYRISRQ